MHMSAFQVVQYYCTSLDEHCATCCKVVIGLGILKQERAQATQHLKEDPSGSIHISRSAHSGLELLRREKVLHKHLGCNPTGGAPEATQTHLHALEKIYEVNYCLTIVVVIIIIIIISVYYYYYYYCC